MISPFSAFGARVIWAPHTGHSAIFLYLLKYSFGENAVSWGGIIEKTPAFVKEALQVQAKAKALFFVLLRLIALHVGLEYVEDRFV
jgi:hypothetical protein